MISPSDIQIEIAKRQVHHQNAHHEHDDCIQIAYGWLDAQKKLKNTRASLLPLKDYIERWAGRYISQSDVEVAAALHPLIKGSYPAYNISSRLTEPSLCRLNGIRQANTQPDYRKRHKVESYAIHED